MIPDTSNLPNDLDELKKIIADLHEKQQIYSSEIEVLREQVSHLYNKLFGRKSEKDKYAGESPQLPLFDIPEPDPDQEQPVEKQTEVKGHTRTKGKRKPLPAKLPRVDVVHDITEEEKVCHCGSQMSRIGEEVSEKLDIIPAVIKVIRHVRPKYSCKQCENIEKKGPTVKIAPVPAQLLPKAIASGGPYGTHSDC